MEQGQVQDEGTDQCRPRPALEHNQQRCQAAQQGCTDQCRVAGVYPEQGGQLHVTHDAGIRGKFSQTGTDVVPYIALSGGYGALTVERDDTDQDYDATRVFGQIGFGIRFFGWDGIAFSLEGFYRNSTTSIEGDIDDIGTNSDDWGALLGFSVFF